MTSANFSTPRVNKKVNAQSAHMTINYPEIQICIDALQTKYSRLLETSKNLREKSPHLAAPIDRQIDAVSKLLDKMRVGWKSVEQVPEQVLREKEAGRHWSGAQEETPSAQET